MADLRTLGPVGNTVNLLDSTKYRIPVRTENENPIKDVVDSPVRGMGLINVALAEVSAVDLGWQVWVTGASWQAVLDNYAAIQTRLDLAVAYSTAGTGTVVQYQEQAGNQSSATVWVVKYGFFSELRALRSVALLRKVGQLTLHCEPQ